LGADFKEYMVITYLHIGG